MNAHRLVGRAALVLTLTLALGACGLEDPGTPVDPSASVTDADEMACLVGLSESVLEEMRGHVDALLADGLVNDGQHRALTRHLDNSSRALARGSFCAARDQFVALRQQLDELVGDGFLSDREAFELRLAWRIATPPEGEIAAGEEEQYAPGAVGEPRFLVFGGEEVEVQVIDGLAIIGGDQILGFADELEGAVGATSLDGLAMTGPCALNDLWCSRWHGREVGYEFILNWGASTPVMVDAIEAAIRHWEDMTDITFVPRSTGDRVIFRNGGGCSSWLGNDPVVDVQSIFLNESLCTNVGTIIHEIGHTLGLLHEHARNDRDHQINVDFRQIRQGAEHNFYKYLTIGLDLIGLYDFGSIMHYQCETFRADGATRDPIQPLVEGVSCDGPDGIGQRVALSDGDRLGYYWLYRPAFEITGAEMGETRDHFDLGLDFVFEPVEDRFIEWFISRDGEPVARRTGQGFSTLDIPLENGDYRVVARVWIHNREVARSFVDFTIENEAPIVDLGPDFTTTRGTFSVTSTVMDDWDGDCPVASCTYRWDPVPFADRGGVADYRFIEEGDYTIGLTVTDGAGFSGYDEVIVTVVRSQEPAQALILEPADGAVFYEGDTSPLIGRVLDLDLGPEPRCSPTSNNDFRSSDPSDVLRLTGTPERCDMEIDLGAPGPRTLTLIVEGNVDEDRDTTSIDIEVRPCGPTDCPPQPTFEVRTPSELDGQTYDPPFIGIGYHLDTPIELVGRIRDAQPQPITYEWYYVAPLCVGGCAEVVFNTGAGFESFTTAFAWTPSETVAEWSACVTTPLPFVVGLRATDSDGNERAYEQTIYLACPFI